MLRYSVKCVRFVPKISFLCRGAIGFGVRHLNSNTNLTHLLLKQKLLSPNCRKYANDKIVTPPKTDLNVGKSVNAENLTKICSFDYAIKYLLKDKGNYNIVEGFISALLATIGYKPVKITALLESQSNREESKMKHSIADVIVEDNQGQKFIVEIDRAPSKDFLYKACFNCRIHN